MKKVAIIDLGSNSVRMNIARINSNGTTEVLSQAKKTVRLSEGMNEDMTLKITPMYRTIAALSEFNDIIAENGVSEITAIATAAVRSAVNKDAFLSEIKNAIGIDMKVISGDMEAVYDYLGVISKLEVTDCLIVDVGGASTEIILVKGGELIDKASLPMGAVSISEQFLQEKESKENIVLAINLVESYINTVGFLADAKDLPIIGIGGSNRTIARIDMKEADDSKMIHGHEVSIAKVVEIYNDLIGKSTAERSATIGVGKDRGDIIVGGLLPIVSIIKRITAKKLIISDSGVRDGLLFEKTVETFNNIIKKCKLMDGAFSTEPPVATIKVGTVTDTVAEPVDAPLVVENEMSAYDQLFQTAVIPDPIVDEVEEEISEDVVYLHEEPMPEPKEELSAEELAEKAAYEALFEPRFD